MPIFAPTSPVQPSNPVLDTDALDGYNRAREYVIWGCNAMAKIILAGVAEKRGAEGGVVFSRNRYGAYTRQRVSPVQPRTDYQLDIRAKLQTVSAAWRDLSQAEKNAWNELASQVILTDSIGQTYSPTGHQLFTSCNINRLLGQATILTTPPATVPNVPTPLNVTVTATSGATPALTVAWSGGSADYDAFIYATATVGLGRKFIRPSELRFMQVAAGDGSPAVSILAAWQARYGPVPTTGKVVVAVRLVQPDTGFAGGVVRGEDTW